MAKSQIVLPKVGDAFDDAKAGARVDAVLSTLTSQLQNLKAADTAAVGGQDAAVIGSSGVFFQTFENPVTTWTKRTDAGTVDYPSNGKAGGKAFRSSGGESFYEFPENIPFNDDRLYRVRARFRMTTAPTDSAKDLVYVGVQAYAADGVTLVDTSGGTDASLAHWYAAAAVDMGALTLSTWYTYTGYFKGVGTASTTPSTDADAPRVISTNGRYIRPCFRLNASGGNGVMELDYISLEVLTEGTEGNQLMKDVVNLGTGKVATDKVVEGSITAGAITAAKIAANTITASQIAAGTITATEIASSTITATQIAASTITAGKLASLTGAGLTINFAATGTQPCLSHTNFSILANGTATFSGSLSAASGSFAGSLSAATGTFSGALQANTITIKDGGGTTQGEIYTGGGGMAFRDSSSNSQMSVTAGVVRIINILDLITSGAALKVGSTVKLTSSSGTWTLAATAGSLQGYMNVTLDGTAYKIPVYNT